MAEVRASKHILRQVINTAKVNAPNLLGSIVYKYRTYVLLTVSALLQHTPVVKTEASVYYTSSPPDYIWVCAGPPVSSRHMTQVSMTLTLCLCLHASFHICTRGGNS